jgi:hypothetical protein
LFDADPAVVEEAGERRPALEQVVDRPRDLGMARELGARAAHPGLEFGNEGRDRGLAECEAVRGGSAVDRALRIENRVDPLDRLDRQRGDDRELAPRVQANLGEHEDNLHLACAQHADSSTGPGFRSGS